MVKLSRRMADALLAAPGVEHGFEQIPVTLELRMDTLAALEARGLVTTRLTEPSRVRGAYAWDWDWHRTTAGEDVALEISLERERKGDR